MLRMLALIVLNNQCDHTLDLSLYVLDVLIHHQSLIGGNILQLGKQLPHVDLQHLQLLLEFEHGERVLM